MYIWVGAALAFAQGRLGDGFTGSGWEALFVVAYAPLLLWGPLVAAVTFDYWRRHRRPGRRTHLLVGRRSHTQAPSRPCR